MPGATSDSKADPKPKTPDDASVRAKRAEVSQKILAYRAREIGRVRRRFARFFQLVVAATALVFASSAILSRQELRSSLDSYHGLCGQIHDGDPLEAVRGLASERRIVFERDDDLSHRYDDDIYVLRPELQWPTALSCPFRAVAARVYRL